MASLSRSHSVDGHKPPRQQASALCHAQCFKAYLRLQLQLRPLRRPLWSSHAYSLCHSQLSTARLLGRSALFGPLRHSATPVLGRSRSAAEDAWRKASPSLLLWCSAPRLVCPQLLALLPSALACSCARSPPALGHRWLFWLSLTPTSLWRSSALALARSWCSALSAISPSGAQFWRPTTPWCSQAISRSGAQLPSTPCLSAAQSWRFPVTSRSDAHGHLGSHAVKTRSLSVTGAQFEISHSAVLFASQPN